MARRVTALLGKVIQTESCNQVGKMDLNEVHSSDSSRAEHQGPPDQFPLSIHE